MANRRRQERPGQPGPTRRESPNTRRRPTMGGGVAATSPEARRRGLGSGSARSTTSPEARRTGLGSGSVGILGNTPGKNRNIGSIERGTGHYGRGARPVSRGWEENYFSSNQPVRVLPDPYPEEDSGGFWQNLYSAATAPGRAVIDSAKGLGSNIAGFFDDTGLHPNAYLPRFVQDQTFGEGTVGYGPFSQNAAGDWYGGVAKINVDGNIPGRPMPGVFQGGQQVFADGTGNFYRYESDPRTSVNAVTPWNDNMARGEHGANPYERDLWGYGYDTHQYGRDRLMEPARLVEWVDDYPHIRGNPAYGDFSPSSYRYGPND